MSKPKKQKFKPRIGVGDGTRDLGKGPKVARQLRQEGWRGKGANANDGEVLYPPNTPGTVAPAVTLSVDKRPPVTSRIKVVQNPAWRAKEKAHTQQKR